MADQSQQQTARLTALAGGDLVARDVDPGDPLP
jgi:hypothetical protein